MKPDVPISALFPEPLFDVFGHGYKDCNQFVRLLNQPVHRFRIDMAIVPQEFQPQLGFIRFLGALFDF